MATTSDNKPTFVKIDGIFKDFCRRVVEMNYDEIQASHNEEGSFYELYSKYENDCQKMHFFIIDEINRADLSKVFGELMFGLEESYRGIEHSFETQYQNLKTYCVQEDGKASPLDFDCFEKGFFIPKNICIIGTMNDIDKSVEAFDFALRRRFEWIEIKAKDVIEDALKSMLNVGPRKVKPYVDKINAMNEMISTEGKKFGLSDAYHIGHAYFKDLKVDEPNSLENIFNTNIVSILKEYTRGRNKHDVDYFIENCANALGVTYVK